VADSVEQDRVAALPFVWDLAAKLYAKLAIQFLGSSSSVSRYPGASPQWQRAGDEQEHSPRAALCTFKIEHFKNSRGFTY